MFYLRYLRAELVRRKGRTIVTLLGLALGVGLVITISSLSKGLDDAQAATLDPLGGIGTDLTVTRSAPEEMAGGPLGGGGGRDLVEANQSVLTDLSKLGKPGERFVHDFFLPGTQLTFSQSQAKAIEGLDEVAAVSSGLMLQAVHQEGKVPKIVAKIKTGGDRIDITRRIEPPSPAEMEKIQACIEKQGGSERGGAGGGLGGRQRPCSCGRRRHRPRQPRRVREVPARADAEVPGEHHDAARDPAAGPRTRRRPTSRASRTRSQASRPGIPRWAWSRRRR